MNEPKHGPTTARAAVVLRPEDVRCEVSFGSETSFVRYGVPFSPRAKTLTPGHLVAVTDQAEAGPLVLWRWYDAVVLDQSADQVRLWEPGHGEVLAQSRDDQTRYAVGTRAYASAGLPGAEWWVEGPVAAVDAVDVAMDEVVAFYTENDLWRHLT